MASRKKLEAEIVRLTYRVAELEERLCPCESHDWKWIDSRFVYIGMGNIEPIRQYKCKVCGKEKEG